MEGKGGVVGARLGIMPSLEQEVIEQEGGIETGVAEVDDFVVDGKESGAGVDEEVLGREVAVGEGAQLGASLLDGAVEMGIEVGVAGGGEAVVGIEAELVEEVEAGKVMVGGVGLEEEGVEVGGLGGEGEVDFAGKKLLFPGGGVRVGGGHGEEVVGLVGEEDLGKRAGRSERDEEGKRVDFAEDAAAIGKPVFGDAELGEGVFEDEVGVAGKGGAEDEVGDTAGEFPNRNGVGGKAEAFSQVVLGCGAVQIDQETSLSGAAEQTEETTPGGSGLGRFGGLGEGLIVAAEFFGQLDQGFAEGGVSRRGLAFDHGALNSFEIAGQEMEDFKADRSFDDFLAEADITVVAID